MKQSNKEKLNYILFIVILAVGEILASLVAVGMVRSTWPAGTAGGRGTDSVLICFSQGFQSPKLQPSFDVSSPEDFL
jgi:hypothetical protein